MRNLIVAVVSFALGAISVAALGNHTSTFAQESTKRRRPFTDRIIPSIPVVPPFNGNFVSVGSFVKGETFSLDGTLCRNCRFEDVTFMYGGGEYVLEDASIKLPVDIELEGAALNTAKFLNTFGLIGCHANQAPPSTTPPILKARYAPNNGTLKSEHAN